MSANSKSRDNEAVVEVTVSVLIDVYGWRTTYDGMPFEPVGGGGGHVILGGVDFTDVE